MVLDCMNWLEGDDLEFHRPAINAAANWDFATVAVYTCSANCSSGKDATMVEEYVALINEEQCHVADELKLVQ